MGAEQSAATAGQPTAAAAATQVLPQSDVKATTAQVGTMFAAAAGCVPLPGSADFHHGTGGE